MTDINDLPEHISQALDDVDDLSPADELTTYEHVLQQLTELLNAGEHTGQGSQ